MTIYVSGNEAGYSRIGISISKSWAKAAIRNRMKRLVRESFRLNYAKINAGMDYLVIISSRKGKNKESITKEIVKNSLTFFDVEKSFLTLTSQIDKRLRL
jgi:ribonuclease P protein component